MKLWSKQNNGRLAMIPEDRKIARVYSEAVAASYAQLVLRLSKMRLW
jgi:hypothetical protein